MKIHPALRDFNPRDYGFKSGLEVHHQLLTEKKLFCHCPAGLYSDKYDAQALRHMRPTLSELGEYDGTALMEFKTKKEIIYRLNKESVCTYEMDDNPPFLINRQAVDIAIEIALMLNCAIVGELHVSRKQYLDGSIPAGFQRTAIVGVNGWIPYKDRKIGIIQLAVEEDACREISDDGHYRVYATDRLSMPLIEVVTAPDLQDPQEVFEAGKLIGHLLRTTGKVRRGIGSVRQDVNVSVTGGTRIEIKGVPRIPLFPALTFYEAYRQHKLLELKDVIASRGVTEENFEAVQFDATSKFSHPAIKNEENAENFKIGVIVLKGMNGLLAHRIGGSRSFADDVAGRVRVIACIGHKPVLLHTDKDANYGLSEGDRRKLASITGMKLDRDAAVVVWGDKCDVDMALSEVEIRFREAFHCIPNETRQALDSGETDFERILPGPDRMYPDTDSPPLSISREEVDQIRTLVKERPWERTKRLKETGLTDELIDRMIISPRLRLFDKLVQNNGFPSKLVAYTLGELLIHARRLGGDVASLTDEKIEELFSLLKEKGFGREVIRPILEEWAKTGDSDWDRIADRLHIQNQPEILDDALMKAKDNLKNVRTDDPEARQRFLIGEIMYSLRWGVPGKEVAGRVAQI